MAKRERRMRTSTRTTHRNSQAASIQTKQWKALATVNNLRAEAGRVLSEAQYEAYHRGISDFENSTRDHPPYGFSDLQKAWKKGWLAASQGAIRKRKCAGE